MNITTNSEALTKIADLRRMNGYRESPQVDLWLEGPLQELELFLKHDARRVEELVATVALAKRYLEHPDVQAIPFALP